MPTPLTRRTLLHAAVLSGAGLVGAPALAGCSPTPQPTSQPTPQTGATSAVPDPSPTRTLLAYFSRAGENYYYGGRRTLTVGNTEVLAGMIRDRIRCDVHRIEAADPYSDDYDDTVARNVREQQADTRPAIANPLPNLDAHDIVLIGSPIWNVRAPMIMLSFLDGLDLSGKRILPFTTHAMSGLGTVDRDYAAAGRGATIGEGLAVQGEEVASAAAPVEQWLRRVGLAR